MMGWNGGWWGFGMLGMGLFWVVVLGAIVWAVGRLTSRPEQSPPNTQETSRQVLDRRFATGQLDEGQYVEARRMLEGGSTFTRH